MEQGHDIFEHHLRATQRFIESIPRLAANHARNFFDKSWTNKGFTDSAWQPWRAVKDKNGKIKERPLVQSGRLRRSLRTEPGIVYTDVEYAQIHNEGGIIQHTESVRQHTRKGKSVKAHTRNVNRVVSKREFMGPSRKLEGELEDLIIEGLDAALTKK